MKNAQPVLRGAVYGLSVVLFLLWALFYSLQVAGIDVPVFHLDGAFQTASGLFRLDRGQCPGRDFFPYLGIGPLVSLYPAFKVLGGDLAASGVSAQLMILLFAWVSAALLWHLIFRPRSVAASAAAGAVAMVAPIMVSTLFSLPNPLEFATAPGNSLKPVRAAAPYLVAIVVYAAMTRCRAPVARNLILALATGGIMLWANDFAVPTAALTAVFVGGSLYLSERPTWRRQFLGYLLMAALAYVMLLMLTTHGHPLPLLRYNVLDVARDQWWYFGPYGESDRIFRFSQIGRLVSPDVRIPLVVLMACVIVAAATRTVEHVLVAWLGLALFAGGSLASLGGHLGGYFGGFFVWGVTVAVMAALRLLQRVVAPGVRGSAGLPLGGALRLLVLVALLVSALMAWNRYRQDLAAAQTDPSRILVPELGAYLDRRWADHIEFARRHSGRKVIEDYWGLWSSLTRGFAPWPVDSLIHALGSVRGQAQAGLADAEFIVTTRYSFSPEWQPWGLSQNFWFYDALLSEWSPEVSSPSTIIWRRNGSRRPREAAVCDLSKDGRGFVIRSEPGRFFRVALTYEVSGAGRSLAMIRNNISFGGGAKGYVSIDPNASSLVMPVLVTDGSGGVFDSKIVGNPNAAVTITSCVAESIGLSDPEVLHGRGS